MTKAREAIYRLEVLDFLLEQLENRKQWYSDPESEEDKAQCVAINAVRVSIEKLIQGGRQDGKIGKNGYLEQ